MIDFFAFWRRPESHYEQEAEGPKIHVKFLTTNEKIVAACKDLDAYARERSPAPELTEAQQKEIQKGQVEREMRRMEYDRGIFLPHTQTSAFRIKE